MKLREGLCAVLILTGSWYSEESLKAEGTWVRTKGVMANGQEFSDNRRTCACNLYPLGSWLFVTNMESGKRIIVQVTDRISEEHGGTRIDLSKSAMEALGGKQALKDGLLPVKVEKLIKRN